MEVTPSPAEAPASSAGVEAAVADAASTSVAAVAATVAVVAVVAPVVASAHLGPWIFVCDAGDVNCGGGRSAHVIQWDKGRRKPTPNGVFGWASCLASFPPDQALPTDGFRIHVCCQNPCPVKNFHPGKFGNLPPPRAHGRFVAAASEGLVEEDLVRYVELLSGVPPPPLPPPPLPEQPPPLPPPSAEPCPPAVAVAELTAAPALEPAPLAVAESPAGTAVAGGVVAADSAVVGDEAASDVDEAAMTATAGMIAFALSTRHPRTHIGFVELVAFCVRHRRRLLCVDTGDGLDVMSVIAPGLIDERWNLIPFYLRLVFAKKVDDSWRLAGHGDATHFMVACPWPQTRCLDGVGSAVAESPGIVKQCERQGYMVIPTRTDGDCGIDALTLVLGMGRTPENRQKVRSSIFESLMASAAVRSWHTVFRTAQELAPVLGSHAVAAASAELPAVAGSTVATTPTTAALVPAEGTLTDAAANAVIPAVADAFPDVAASVVPFTGCGREGGSAESGSVAEDSEQPEAAVAAAVRSATGLKKPTAAVVRRMCACLRPDEAAAIVAWHAQAISTTAVAVVSKNTTNGVETRYYRATTLWQRSMDGKAFSAFAASRGLDHRSPDASKLIRSFLRESTAHELTPADLLRGYKYIRRCVTSLQDAVALPLQGRPGNRGSGQMHNQRLRKRRTGKQGRPQKALLVKHLLWRWFVSIKRSVKTRLPVKIVLTKAHILMEEWISEHLKRGVPAVAGEIGYVWLSRWKKEYGVSFRKPNRKWSVPLPVLRERLETTWLNVARVRMAIMLAFGYDPVIENFDQSPFHMNEVGSKNAGSLQIRGCGPVALKEGHAATRERWTANTMATSSVERGRAIPPLQLMFRIKSGGGTVVPRLRESIPPWAARWLTVVASESGSYAECDVLNYLEEVLEPGSPDRDWRILMVDAYSAQNTDAVRRLAWHRKYVLVTIGGGCTGIIQVPDTDLHQILKRMYGDLEMADALAQSRLRPTAIPIPRKPDCIEWMAAIWGRGDLHVIVRDGFWKTGMANDLSGVEDHKICKEAGQYWRELNMTAKRGEACRVVEAEFAANRLAWRYDDINGLVVPFAPRAGRHDDQPSDDGSDDPDDDGGEGTDHDDDDDGGGVHLPVAGGSDGPAVAGRSGGTEIGDRTVASGSGGSAVAGGSGGPEVAGLSSAIVPMRPEDAAVANDMQYTLDVLRSVLVQVQAIGDERLAVTVARALHSEERRSVGRLRSNPAVAEALEANHQATLHKAIAGQTIAERTRLETTQQRKRLAELREDEARLDRKRLAIAKACTVVESMDALKAFPDDAIGVGHKDGGTKAHRDARQDILRRLRLRAAPLPPDLDNDWEWFVQQWDKRRVEHLPELDKCTWGYRFRETILGLLGRIRKDEPDVLAKWMRDECRRYLHLPQLHL